MIAHAHPGASPRGISLTEVLFAILVMGIGVVSLAALFPVGLDATRQAMRDSRVALLAQNGRSKLLTLNINDLVNLDAGARDELKTDNDSTLTNPPTAGVKDGQSAWIVFDPVGMLAENSPPAPADMLGNLIGRFNGGFTSTSAAKELCHSPDDVEFDKNGNPISGAVTHNYMWVAFFRRTDVGTETGANLPIGKTCAIDLKVALFYRREYGADAEHVYTGTFGTEATDGRPFVTLSSESPAPQFRVGSYLIDIRNGGEYVEFYRIENFKSGTTKVYIDRKGDSSSTGNVMVVPGLVGVFPSRVLVDFQ